SARSKAAVLSPIMLWPEKVSAPLMARRGEIDSFKPTPDGARVVYLADQRFFEKPEVWSVPSEGGVPVRLSPDLDGDDVITGFTIDPSSRWVLIHLSTSQWISPVDASAPPAEVTLPAGQLSSAVEFTPDGRHFIARGVNGLARTTLFRVPTDGGPIVELLPPDLTSASPESGGRSFDLTPDGERVVFAAKPVNHNDFAANRIYSIPVTGGEPILLSTFPLSRVLSLTLSADGSYVVFAGRPVGVGASAIYGSPTQVANTVELWPPFANFFSFYPHFLDDDASHLAILFRDDAWVLDIETGVARNLTESYSGQALEMQSVNGGEDLLVLRSTAQGGLDAFDIDGDGSTPQTSAFPAPTLYEYFVNGETLIMLVDPDSTDPAVRPLIFARPLAAPPGAGKILSDPTQRAFPPIRVGDDFVSYVSAGRIAYAADLNGGPRILLRPAADAIRDTLLDKGRYFYVATEPDNELPELHAIDIAAAVIVFRDGFESGDTARWSSTVGSSGSAVP
ncbi:MAG: hypothetical protein AAFY88_14610, partial [Acidobacteriota bacterium]